MKNDNGKMNPQEITLRPRGKDENEWAKTPLKEDWSEKNLAHQPN
jgi:hypothetical protein